MITMELTKGKFCLIDQESVDIISEHNWHCTALHGSSLYYAATNVRKGDRQKQVLMHRLIMGCRAGQEVDHIDGNGLNNQRSNLRLATHQQNLFNQKKRAGGTSSYKGVSWCKRSEKWLSQIMINKKTKFLGYFADELSAAVAYDTAAIALFGEFARKNFSDSVNLALVKVSEDFEVLGT